MMANDIDDGKFYSYTISSKGFEDVGDSDGSSRRAVSNGTRLKEYLKMNSLKIDDITRLSLLMRRKMTDGEQWGT